jgi:hypothetical protein
LRKRKRKRSKRTPELQSDGPKKELDEDQPARSAEAETDGPDPNERYLREGVSSDDQVSLISPVTATESEHEVEVEVKAEDLSVLDAALLGTALPSQYPGKAAGTFEDPAPDLRCKTLIPMESLVHWENGEIIMRANKGRLNAIWHNPLFKDHQPNG